MRRVLESQGVRKRIRKTDSPAEILHEIVNHQEGEIPREAPRVVAVIGVVAPQGTARVDEVRKRARDGDGVYRVVLETGGDLSGGRRPIKIQMAPGKAVG